MDPFAPAAKFILLYDGHCPLCRRSVDFLMERKGAERLQPMPLQTPGILERFGIEEAAALREIQVVDRQGRVIAGADGVLTAMAALPRWRWLGLLMHVPGVMPIGRRVYRQIANRRNRDVVCEDGACSLKD